MEKQRQLLAANEEDKINSVRLSNIMKIMPNNDNVMRHLDIIFKQLEECVGLFARVIIFEEAKRGIIEDDTIGFVQLVNQAEHRNLAFYLNGYQFHGRVIGARLAYLQHYGHIGNLYTSSPGNCNECEKYLIFLNEYEEDLQRSAIQRARDSIQIHVYASKRRAANNVSENLIDFDYDHNNNETNNTLNIHALESDKQTLEINQQTQASEIDNVQINNE